MRIGGGHVNGTIHRCRALSIFTFNKQNSWEKKKEKGKQETDRRRTDWAKNNRKKRKIGIPLTHTQTLASWGLKERVPSRKVSSVTSTWIMFPDIWIQIRAALCPSYFMIQSEQNKSVKCKHGKCNLTPNHISAHSVWQLIFLQVSF